MAQCELGCGSFLFPLLFNLYLVCMVTSETSAARCFSKSGMLATINNVQKMCCKKSRIRSMCEAACNFHFWHKVVVDCWCLSLEKALECPTLSKINRLFSGSSRILL